MSPAVRGNGGAAGFALFMEYAEYDWVYTIGLGSRLHHLATVDDPETVEAEWRATGTATCGLRATFELPGIISRMGMPRCARCSDKLGWPRGDGSPKNDSSFRGTLQEKLAALRANANPTNSRPSAVEPERET